MPDFAILAVFIPTFFFVSITPGMCMTLAMTLGMSVGVRRTLWMMAGEVIGVALVAIAAVVGVASVMLNYPSVFQVFKWVGGAYLAYLGIKMFFAHEQVTTGENISATSRGKLASQGFITAIANPKGWAFMISLLPPFISVTKSLSGQLTVLVGLIMLSEFLCMLIYATGGKSLRLFLNRGNNIRWMNRIAGSLLVGLGCWLAFIPT
ncbi:MAG: LysE family translocator [Alteromonadaceae bacterium]|uniref:LysE family translocator n=2 Tax=Paraglaciecola chathamensis TaxID=368405 RepID=A0A8H9LX35_9ALTE|nr:MULTISPECIES: LysE family translocator [Paraglaciecola]MBJ2137849.1 LysE family translocator [Paraglaciecola chathamensis]MBN26666.1 LysE family translocator [Alteromonadaceae bacterium]GAC07079.1 lysine exporter protein [Paraglaciecola agarilytica NO2]GGZ67830.1 threonine transporter RhtB [Paraglaciecola oceanifecundans]|tara:strand:- start:70132 stop:70752 length:621 start_codon:yes stop_codon:yes gene_type:complete